MERLKGKTIFIGKEPGQGRLLIAIKETGKSVALGPIGSVPGSVSRCKTAEGVAHAQVNVEPSGTIKITNLKPQNVTFVNGTPVMSKIISETQILELGKDRFKVGMPLILEAAKKLLPEPKKIFSITHLAQIYNDYEEENEKITLEQQKIGKKRMLPFMISSASGLLSAIGAAIALETLYFTLPVSAIVSFLYFKNYNSKDTSNADRKEAIKKLQQLYRCPNPDCRHYYGVVPYELLKNQCRNVQDHKIYCPKCKCEYTEK